MYCCLSYKRPHFKFYILSILVRTKEIFTKKHTLNNIKLRIPTQNSLHFSLTFQFDIVSGDFSDMDQIFHAQNARENKQRHLADVSLLLIWDKHN